MRVLGCGRSLMRPHVSFPTFALGMLMGYVSKRVNSTSHLTKVFKGGVLHIRRTQLRMRIMQALVLWSCRLVWELPLFKPGPISITIVKGPYTLCEIGPSWSSGMA